MSSKPLADFGGTRISRIDVMLHGTHVGALAATPEGLAAFQYDEMWLSEGYSISPLSLPLDDRVFVAERHPLDGLFGVFGDSLPDGWGRLLVDRMLKRNGIDPSAVGFMERLAIVGSSGAGALEYVPAVDFPKAIPNADLDALAADCALILSSHDAEDLDTLFEMGGSSGGARPKVYYDIDGEEWIVKFPSSFDPDDAGEREYRLSLAAKACGIEMPDTRLMPSARCSGYFATKRFDRICQAGGDIRKVHMASAAALLETSHRIPNLDYELLMRLTLRLTGDMGEVERMFHLMAFNVACGNCDDHSKNFTFMHDEARGWRLSPAYDLTESTGYNGERATTVNGKGRDITDADMLEVARSVGIPAARARHAISEVRDAIASM